VREVRDIKAAVVGTGFIGVVHVEALRRLGVEVTGVVGSTPERAAAKARAAALPAPYASLEAMLADPAVDVVHLTTPNHLHYEQVKATLAAGKHVVCEKPLAMDSAETAELVRLAEQSGLVHAVNFNVRFYGQCQKARALVQAGGIGDVRLISGGYLQDWLLLDTDWNWRLDPAEGGSLRAVGDIGSHWLDLVQFVTGQRVEAVMADLTTFIPVRKRPTGPVETFSEANRGGGTVDTPMETEDAAGILLRLSGGARAVLTVSQVSAGRKNRLSWEIDGSRSALAWHSEAPEELWIGHRERPNELLLRETGDYPPGHAEGFPDTFKALYRAVYGAVAAGQPGDGYPTFADGHDEAVIGDAIARSHAEQRWVTVTPVPQEV
jgi:predicted dehydrogenase